MKRILLFILMFCGAQAGAQSNRDSIEIRQAVMTFYDWYLQYHSRLGSFELYTGTGSNDTPPYKMNWTEVERYFDYIRSAVPSLGEEFISNQRKFFQQCDSAFLADPEGEIPYGFDFDWYTNSQEDPGWLVEELKNSTRWIVRVNGTDATADVMGMYNDNGIQVEALILCYSMKNEAGNWKIARISCPYSKY